MSKKFISNTLVYTQKKVIDSEIRNYGVYGFLTVLCFFIEVLVYCLQTKGYINYIVSIPIIAVAGVMSLFCLWDYADYRKLYFKRRFGQ
jgi:hypothetical protein